MKSFYVGVKAILQCNNSFLFLKRPTKFDNMQYYWAAPGGRIDGDENFEETLRREVKEETGISEISIGELLSVARFPHDIKENHGLLLLYFKAHTAVDRVVLSSEHEAYQWVKKEDLEKFLAENAEHLDRGGLREAIEEIIKQI